MVVFVIGQWSRLIRHINIKNLHLWKIYVTCTCKYMIDERFNNIKMLE